MSSLFGDIQFYMVLGQLFLIGVIYKTHKDNMKRTNLEEKERHLERINDLLDECDNLELCEEFRNKMYEIFKRHIQYTNEETSDRITTLMGEYYGGDEDKIKECIRIIKYSIFYENMDIVKQRRVLEKSIMELFINNFRKDKKKPKKSKKK